MRDNSEMANDHRKAAEPDYLYQQGVRGIWTYRRRIPTDLLHHFDGKREIVRSTKTSDYKSALLQSHQITDHYDKLFAFYRAKDSGSAGILERHRAVQEWLSQHLPEALKANQGDTGRAVLDLTDLLVDQNMRQSMDEEGSEVWTSPSISSP
jgi:hypothetical protein